jgi:hypothetical protein
MFFATSSSTVGWFVPCAKIAEALIVATIREITKRKCIEGLELDVRQRSATDIQTKSKRKRVSKQKRVWSQPAQSNF